MEQKRESAKLFQRSLQKSRFQLCGGVRANSTAFILWAVLACCSAASELHSEEAKHLRVKKCKYVLLECRCGLYLSNAEVSCRNVSDFEKFAEKLADGSLFEVNATYTIWLSGSSVLPRGFLRGLDVSGLIVDDPPLQGLEEGALEGVLRLQDFMVDKSSIKVSSFEIRT
ncbi:uncharacterized protein CDAR_570881 [Caerostris darwini]|uniref:Uncharacterized protein n=1 Tax=Caerostris darwini TaxID=1538125 RepID=A0AAV4RJV1_9ARAC|nr:uncharacterized protein CDAR_570881 [Caerostris darwini]